MHTTLLRITFIFIFIEMPKALLAAAPLTTNRVRTAKPREINSCLSQGETDVSIIQFQSFHATR